MNMDGMDGRYLQRIWDLFIIGILAGEFIYYLYLRQGRDMSYLGIQPRASHDLCMVYILVRNHDHYFEEGCLGIDFSHLVHL